MVDGVLRLLMGSSAAVSASRQRPADIGHLDPALSLLLLTLLFTDATGGLLDGGRQGDGLELHVELEAWLLLLLLLMVEVVDVVVVRA